MLDEHLSAAQIPSWDSNKDLDNEIKGYYSTEDAVELFGGIDVVYFLMRKRELPYKTITERSKKKYGIENSKYNEIFTWKDINQCIMNHGWYLNKIDKGVMRVARRIIKFRILMYEKALKVTKADNIVPLKKIITYLKEDVTILNNCLNSK